MNKQRLSKIVPPVLALITLLTASLACGSNATPQLVSTAVPVTTSSPAKVDPTATTKADKSTPSAPTDTPVPADTSTLQGPQLYNVGDTVNVGDGVLIVLGWDNFPGNDFSKPDAGNKFIGVDVLIVNTSQSPVYVSSMLHASLKDETGQTYNIDIDAHMAIKKASIDGEFSPGERIRGTFGFQVPEKVTGLQFVFDAEAFDTGKIFVTLGDTPVSNEPPTKVEGETEQQTFKVGDTVEIGDLTLVVNEVKKLKGDSYTKPDKGNIFLVVDVTIVNKSSSPQTISSFLQMWLKDETGQVYKLDSMASVASGGATPDGEIAVGEKVRGQVGYQVPENATGLVFVFDGNVWGGDKVFVALP